MRFVREQNLSAHKLLSCRITGFDQNDDMLCHSTMIQVRRLKRPGLIGPLGNHDDVGSADRIIRHQNPSGSSQNAALKEDDGKAQKQNAGYNDDDAAASLPLLQGRLPIRTCDNEPIALVIP